MSFLSSLIAPLFNFLGKILPYLAAFKLGGDRKEHKYDKKDAKILEKQRNIKSIRTHVDARERVRRLREGNK